MPSLEIIEQKGLFLHKLELDLNFTSPRESLSSLNHHSIDLKNALGVKYQSFFMTFSLDLRYMFEGNSDILKEGFIFGNSLKVGIEF